MPNRSGQFSPGHYTPASSSFNMEAPQYVPYCVSPLPARIESPMCSQQNSPQTRNSPLSFRPFVNCPTSLPLDIETPPVVASPVFNGPVLSQQSPMTPQGPPSFRKFIPSSVALEMDASRQYCLSPITAEMEKFFSYPTMSVTFMPCVCVPDYPVEEGKPRKICRRCSLTPSTNG